MIPARREQTEPHWEGEQGEERGWRIYEAWRVTCIPSLCMKTKCLRRKLRRRARDGSRGVESEGRRGRGRGKRSGDCQRGEDPLVDGTSGISCYRRKGGGKGEGKL